jgi:hypothetical protein
MGASRFSVPTLVRLSGDPQAMNAEASKATQARSDLITPGAADFRVGTIINPSIVPPVSVVSTSPMSIL